MNDSTTKLCRTCGFEYPLTPEYFYRNSDTHDGFQNSCKVCRSLSCGHVPKEKYPEGYKRCNVCQELKPLKEFHRYKNATDGYRYTCKLCRAKEEGFNYKPPVEQGERRCSICKGVFPATNEYFYSKDGRYLHSNCIPCYKERNRKHAHNHPEWATAGNHNRRARKLYNGGMYSLADVRLLIRTQPNCWWCGKKLNGKHHLDHRIPLARGGANSIGNLCLSCPKCNQRKSAKMPWEFNGRLL